MPPDDKPELTSMLELISENKRLRKIVDQVDDVLVVNWAGPRVDGDYRKALADLVSTNIDQHDYFTREKAREGKPDLLLGPVEEWPEDRPIPTYRTLEAHKAIQCLKCGLTSFNKQDVENLYCGKCHEFHSKSAQI